MTQLKTYTGVVQILEKTKVTINYGEQTQLLTVYAVNVNVPNLMAREWLRSLKVFIGDIHRLGMPDKHKSTFTEELGTFKKL